MAVVTNTEIIAKQVGRWEPSDVAYVRRITFGNFRSNSFDMALVVLIQPRPPLSAGWPDPSGPFFEAAIRFHGVRNLKLMVCGPWDIQTPGFTLEDIRDRQWDEINLLVDDYEGLTDEGIRFGARSAEVCSCRPAEFPPNSPVVWRQYPGEFNDFSDGIG